MQRHIFDKNQPQGSMSLMNVRNTLRGLFQGDLMPLRPRASLVLDDMEYPSDAGAAAEWSGTGITVTFSTTKQEGNYSVQAVTDATPDRILANNQALDIGAFGSLTLWTRCASISSAIKFYVKDITSGNISYWDITTHGTADTWKQDTIDLTTPDSNNGSDADLADIGEYGYSALDASETYLFDTIKAIVGLCVAVDASNVGSFYKQVYLGNQPLEIGAKASPAITPPSANSRIDILAIDSTGALAWVAGDEAATPVAKWASLTAGTMPICLVYCKTTMVKVVDYEDAAANPNEAYIYADLRPMYGIGASPVDETDTDAAKDKLVSNNLAKGWEAKAEASHTHIESEITDLDHDAVAIQGVDVDAPVAGDDGKFLRYNHSGPGFSLETTGSKREVFISSGTFTVPAGRTKVYISGAGSGAGGGGGGTGAGAGGGSSGAMMNRKAHTVTPLAELTVAINAAGAGGAINTDGADGGTTVFDTLVLAGGNKGIRPGGGATGGVAAGSGLDAAGTTIKGGAGADGVTTTGGAGGSTYFGVGGASAAAVAGNVGTYGGGGSGGGFSGSGEVGGAGGDGIIIVEW